MGNIQIKLPPNIEEIYQSFSDTQKEEIIRMGQVLLYKQVIESINKQVNILKSKNKNLSNIITQKFYIDFIINNISKNNSLNREDIHFLVTQNLTSGDKKFTDFIEVQNILDALIFIESLDKSSNNILIPFCINFFLVKNNLFPLVFTNKIKEISINQKDENDFIIDIINEAFEQYHLVYTDLKNNG